MKTKTLLFLFLLISGIMSAQVKRVAILETVDKQNNVSYANKIILRANLSKAITNTAGYEAYDRTDIDAIMGEQNFQRTGLVSNDQIKRLGEMTGANYILVAEAVVVDANNMFITAKLLDVETARTIITDNEVIGTSVDAIQKGCVALAKKLFHEEIKKEIVLVSDEQRVVETASLYDELICHPKHEQRFSGIKKYSYGDLQMDEKAFRVFLRNNSPEAYRNYMKATNMIKTGWAVFGVGVAAAVIGGITWSLMGYYDDKHSEALYKCQEYAEQHNCEFYTYSGFSNSLQDIDETAQKLWKDYERTDPHYLMVSGIVLVSSGGGVALASIPILSVGYNKKNKVYSDFNEEKAIKPDLSLNLQTSHNGIGLALNF
ncbi:MAG: hypothetical protein E7075_02375 [Bacteroidales bacterium]|nr:hypothetical protein [Bacteroidales bacterium]